jgi:acyl-CoA reductase-like NAD-dependent aldehyde dehydrogenase
MGGEGLELPSQLTGKAGAADSDDAPDDARRQLEAVAAAWARLSPAARRRIVQVIRDELERSAMTSR